MRGVLIFLVISLLTVMPVNALVREGSDSKGKYFIEDSKNYPVIFIPGVAGSELYSGDHNAWPGWLAQRVTGGYFHTLKMDEKGRSEYNIVPLRSIRKGLEFDLSFMGVWGVFGVYDDFFDYMGDEGYSIEENTESGLRLYDFAYDWRKDNYHTADLLEQKIDKVLKENKADKVIIMAHSMGGIVARLYMKDEKRAKKVAGVIFMGTPHHGSPMPFYAFTHGYNFANSKLSDTSMWEIMGNWEAGYQLLPSYSFIQDNDGANFWPIEKIYGTSWISQQEYEHYLSDPENWKLRYGLPNRDYTKKILQFQKDLGDKLNTYDWVKYYMIEGTGQNTAQYFNAKLEWKKDIDFGPDAARPVLILEPVTTFQGDGTVPARGAKIDGLNGNFTVVTDHGNIPSFSGTHPILTNLRKSINREDERSSQVQNLSIYAKGKLSEVNSWPESGSVFAAIKSWVVSFFVRPDEEKIKLREELRGKAKSELKWAHINVVVAEGTENEERFYLVINDYQLINAGTGRIRPGTAIVNVDSMKTFNDVISGRKNAKDALKDSSITFKGAGITNAFRLKMFQWFYKYS